LTNPKIVTQWFIKARQDIRMAKLILTLEEKFYEHICFNAQQGAEKSIKGYLASKKTRFDKTHDIEVLVALVKGIDPALAHILEPAKMLTKYAARIRYPEEAGEQVKLTHGMAQSAINMAEMVYEEAHKRI
jgi:HEPN domain-containing protein